jgi:hypothetical protein
MVTKKSRRTGKLRLLGRLGHGSNYPTRNTMKTEYQTTIKLVDEILDYVNTNAGEDMSIQVNNLIDHLLNVYPIPQPFDSTADIDLRNAEIEQCRKIVNLDLTQTDEFIHLTSEECMPSLFTVLILKRIFKDKIIIDLKKTPAFEKFFDGYGSIIHRGIDPII